MEQYENNYEVYDPYMERQGLMLPPWFWWLLFPPAPRPPYPPGPPMPGPAPRPPYPPGPPMHGPGPVIPFSSEMPLFRDNEDTTF